MLSALKDDFAPHTREAYTINFNEHCNYYDYYNIQQICEWLTVLLNSFMTKRRHYYDSRNY